ncbi:heparan sulfate glucosamine 3-O-sulfotransferase 1-like [Ptychodera flava]|uniref:heparan sulfate glucosamine 3-O-sulfotransferase 1-like n=1 Tax=Ptychodera flava TaxID=63121 RepID=UPI00396A4306
MVQCKADCKYPCDESEPRRHPTAMEWKYIFSMRNLTIFVACAVAALVYIVLDTVDLRNHFKKLSVGEGSNIFLDQNDSSSIHVTAKTTSDIKSLYGRLNVEDYLQIRSYNSCYSLTDSASPFAHSEETLLPDVERQHRGCRKRLPDFVIIGAKKCGTGALTYFLNTHPGIAWAGREIHFFDANYDKGLSWYTQRMPYTTAKQLVFEKTPKYFVFPHDVPRKMYTDLSPTVKIVLILCDPVRRAVSDFLHESLIRSSVGQRMETSRIPNHYFLATNFAESVMEKSGNLNYYNELIDTGIYIKHILRWLEYFPPSQIHAVDAGLFKSDIVSEMQRLEKFLEVPAYFNASHFYYNSDSEVYCLTFPIKICPSAVHGRTLRTADEKVLRVLREFYRPYNRHLSKLLNWKLTWMDG